MKNEFLNLVTSPLMNMDHTYRYSGTKLVEQESLSQHILDTIILGIRFIDKINTFEGHDYFNDSNYVLKAVYHDLEEVITGDVPRPLKYFNKDTRDSLKNVAEQVAYDLFTSQMDNSLYHYYIWENAKEGREGFILKIVDTLVVANKVIKEVSFLHNFYMLRVAHEVRFYLQEYLNNIKKNKHYEALQDSSKNYIKEVIEGAIQSMESLLTEFQKEVEELNVISQSMI